MFAYNGSMSLPTALYTVAQVRAFDANAIATQGVTGSALMRRAGAAAVRLLRQRWPTASRVVIVCGAGNNGGDGYVVATLLRAAGLAVQLQALVPVGALTGDARRAADDYLATGAVAEAFDAAALQRADVIVDAILGTGFKPPLRAATLTAIQAINASGRPALALDLPSGLDADTGRVAEAAVRAEATISFVALKQGLLLNEAPEYVGALCCDDLQVRLPAGEAARPALLRLSEADVVAALPPRPRAAHKGDAGRVLVVGGNAGMPGAVLLAGEAALRAGAGLVRVATRPEHALEIVVGRPELMCSGVAGAEQLRALLAAADVIVIGPGLGRDTWARSLLAATLAAGKPLVIDADALNLIAEQPGLQLPPGCMLTPHPGEAARLLGTGNADVQADRLAALRQLVAKYVAVAVLKGSGTVIGAPGQVPAICTAGNPGMATAGMGDVLAGAAAAIYAQCHDPWRAACAAVYAHASAGDVLAARVGQRGLLASELAAALTPILNRVSA
jgi:ADP-dependent NAD(P)H-hydrate dehydratase / NAD(P)H-hydrate epimerase